MFSSSEITDRRIIRNKTMLLCMTFQRSFVIRQHRRRRRRRMHVLSSLVVVHRVLDIEDWIFSRSTLCFKLTARRSAVDERISSTSTTTYLPTSMANLLRKKWNKNWKKPRSYSD